MTDVHVHSREVTRAAKQTLIERGVSVEAIAEIVYELQFPYKADLNWRNAFTALSAFF